MFNIPDQAAVAQALGGPSGRDYLPAWPLLEALFSSGALLLVLRKNCANILPAVERRLNCTLSILAFGSLGRSEFVSEYSDLDPLIVVSTLSGKPPNVEDVRIAVLEALIENNFWLTLDDGELIREKRWIDIRGADLKYPVYTTEELINGKDTRVEQRRWQIILESTPLYGRQIAEDVRNSIVPHLAKPLLADENVQARVNFVDLVSRAPKFFSGFENPQFLYKDAFKYWKTRFLREFYAFSNMANLLVSWYVDKHRERVDPRSLSACTTVKMTRATEFAIQMDDKLNGDKHLEEHYETEIRDIMKIHDINSGPLLLFGSTYKTKPARLLHGMIATVLSRFASCWTAIYDEDVRAALRKIPKEHINFDATFASELTDPHARQVVADLRRKRESYLKYMSAAANAISLVFLKGRMWSFDTVSGELHRSLDPFIRFNR